MALDTLLVTQAIVYFIIGALSLATMIPLIVTMVHFNNRCILYCEFRSIDPSHIMASSYSHPSTCRFPIIFAAFCFIYALVHGAYNMYAACRTKDPRIRLKMFLIPFIPVTAVVSIMMLVACCIVSVGLKSACDSFLEIKKRNKYINSCMDVKYMDWMDDYRTKSRKSFYPLVKAAEITGWIAFIMWGVQLVLYIVRIVQRKRLSSRNFENQIEGSDQEKSALF